MGKLIQIIITLLVLYLYIFSPPFRVLPFNISLLFVIPAFVFFFRKAKIKYYFSVFKIEFLLLFLLCSYSFLVGLKYLEFTFFLTNLIFLIQIIPVSIWLYYLLGQISSKLSIDFFKGLTLCLGIVSITASLISILGFAIPELGIYFKYNLQKYDEYLWRYQEHRGFGIADELLFSYAIVQGIILILILNTSRNVFLNFICFLLISFSIIINARIGLIVFAFLPFVLLRRKVFGKYIIGVLLIFLIMAFTNLYYYFTSEYLIGALIFGSSFFQEFLVFFSGVPFSGLPFKEETTFDMLFTYMWVIPETVSELFFGTGKFIFMYGAKTTDIGYLLMLNFGGLIYISIFALFSFYMFVRLIKSNINYPLISYLIIYVFLVANIKGLFFAPESGMKLIILLYVCFVLSKKQLLAANKSKKLNIGG